MAERRSDKKGDYKMPAVNKLCALETQQKSGCNYKDMFKINTTKNTKKKIPKTSASRSWDTLAVNI